MMKRLIAVLITFAMLLSCICFSAFAVSPGNVTPLSMGATTRTIYINGVAYTASFGLEGTVSTGVRSVFRTNARAVRAHKAVNVLFSTAGTGQEAYSGGATTFNGTYDSNLHCYVGVTGTTRSSDVKYGGTDTATGIKSCNSTGILTTVNQDGTAQSFNFSV